MDQKYPFTGEIPTFPSPPPPQEYFSALFSRRGGTLFLPPFLSMCLRSGDRDLSVFYLKLL